MTTTPTAYTPLQLRHLSRIVKAEREVAAATADALHMLATAVRDQLATDGYTATVLDSRAPVWREQLAEQIMPVIARVYDQGFRSQTRATTAAIMPNGEPVPGDFGMADHLATQYLQTVHNRMVGVADDVFRVIADSLEEGRQAEFTYTDPATGITTTTVGESIPQLAARIQTVLADNTRWSGDAVRVARTEVIGANNAGQHAAAYNNAELFGTSSTQVIKEWLDTADERTRETHRIGGTKVLGLDTPFSVGGASLQQPGDPSGPAGEVINCRCTALYHYPGDPGYDEMAIELGALPGVTAAASPQEDDPMTTTPPEAPAPDAPPADGPTHAGLAVQAADTARVLMIQRSLDQDDAPDVLGTWEFPGGGVEDIDREDFDQTAQDILITAARREFTEETGLAVPPGELTGGWASPDGVYQGFVWTTPTEAGAFAELNPDLAAAEAINPDDPERRNPDVSAWWTIDGIQGAGAVIRPEVLASTDWDQFAAPVDPAVIAEAAPDLPDDEEPDDVALGLAAAGDQPPVPLVEPMPETPDGPQKAQDIAADGDPFHGILAPEGVVSGDNRMFAPESLIARDLPLPLMYQDATEDGHDGAVRVGRIDSIWRDTDRYAKPMIRYAGVWDTSDTAMEAKRQVEARVLRGISVDGDQVTTRLVGSDGSELDPMNDDVPVDGVIIEECLEARADGGTLCSVPAFQQAYIANGTYDPNMPEPGQDEVAGVVKPLPTSPEGDTAPAEAPQEPQVASGAPGSPAPAWTLGLVAAASEQGAWVLPAAHFADPHLEGPTALTVTEDGHVYGHLALWGTCHMGVAGKCMEPPMSASNYSFFHTGTVHTDDGAQVNVGQLTIGTGHANLRYNARATVDHYDNTGTAVVDVVMGHDTHGIWYSGHLRPEASPEQVYAMTAAGSVSGDWREVIRGSGQLELVAALVVNVPGYPIGRPALTASAHGPTALVASGMVQPTKAAASIGDLALASDEFVADLTRRIMAGIAREQRLAAARSRVRTHHAATLVARLNERTI